MKYAFVSGGAGGIAGAIIRELDRRGEWTVFATYHSHPIDSLMSEVSDRVIPIQIDITDQASCDRAAEEVRKYTDTLDILANFAGVHTMASLVEGDPVPTLEWIINTNCLGMARVTKSMFPLLKGGRSRIINCSSECGWMQPQPFNSPYAISKFAVEAYTIGLRRELAFLDIPVIKIQPGSFESGMHGEATDGYTKLAASTTHYKDVLAVMKPLMTIAMSHPHPMSKVVNTTMRAIYSKHPRNNYRTGTDLYLAVIDPIPGEIMDKGYKIFLNAGAKIMRKLGKLD